MTEEEVLQAIAEAKKTKAIDFTITGEQLTELPSAIGELTQIAKLNLKDNKLTTLPPEIGKLTQLKRLYISNNKLTELPAEIAQLQNLEIIYAGNNKLTEIPPEIGQLTQLQGLYLGDNNLTTLPPEIQNLTNLKNLDLRKNPLPIPKDITEKVHQPVGIVKYYLEYQTAETEDIQEIKVILIGSEGVGKTCVKRLLTGAPFKYNHVPTLGLDTQNWETEIESNQLTIHLWDFGSKLNMQSIYQCGFSRRCLYLLITDVNENPLQLEYWLEMLTKVGKTAPIIIIGNKIDQGFWTLDGRSTIAQKYPNILTFFELSCKNPENLESLKTYIKQQVEELANSINQVSPNWLVVKEKLTNLENPYLTSEEYKKLCQHEVILETSEQENLLNLLTDLGVVIHREDHLIKPEWFMKNLEQIFNDANFQQATNGVVNATQIQELLQLEDIQQSRLLMRIIQGLELGWLTDTDSMIIPNLTHPIELVIPNDQDPKPLQYKYNIVLPQILPRLILGLPKYIEVYGNNGVVFNNGEDRAFVKIEPEAKTITVGVSGNLETKSEFLTTICNQLEKINRTTPGVIVKQKIVLEKIEDTPVSPPVETEEKLISNPPNRETTPVSPPMETEDTPVSTPKKKKLNKWFLYVGLFLIVVVVIIVLNL